MPFEDVTLEVPSETIERWPTAPVVEAETRLLEKAVVLSVSFHLLGRQRKVDSRRIEVKAADDEPVRITSNNGLLQPTATERIRQPDPKSINVTKRLFEGDEYRAITTLDSQIKTYLATKCLPFPMRVGMYLLPIALIHEVDAKIEAYAELREELVDQFLAVYPSLLDQAREKLGDLFDEADYSPPDVAETKFGFRTQYVNLGLPGHLKDIDKAMFERERQKAERYWSEATEDIRLALREGMLELVDHAVTQLTGKADGKKRAIRDGFAERIQDFLATFNARNLTNDAELQAIVEQAKFIFGERTDEELRNSPSARTSIRMGFEDVRESLNKMIETKPTRGIRFTDDAE